MRDGQFVASPEWLAKVDGAAHFSLEAREGVGPWLATAAARLARVIYQQEVDVVQTHLFEPGLVGVTAARMAGRPVILTRHHTDLMEFIGTKWHVLADRLSATGASRVLGFSEAVRRRLVEAEAIDPAKVDVIHQGFEFDDLVPDSRGVAELRAELGLEGRFVIGDITRFFKGKGHPDLLSAARHLSAEIDNLSVLLVGGGDIRALEALAEAHGVADRTVIAGHRADVQNCYGLMDVVVHPSETEAFCQVLIEAMAAGRPLVSTDVAGAPEVITDGVNGLLVPPRAPAAISKAVRGLHANPDLRAAMAAEGKRSVLARFPASTMIDEQIALYDRVLRDPHSGTRSTSKGPPSFLDVSGESRGI